VGQFINNKKILQFASGNEMPVMQYRAPSTEGLILRVAALIGSNIMKSSLLHSASGVASFLTIALAADAETS
jgi:hypothetical protein